MSESEQPRSLLSSLEQLKLLADDVRAPFIAAVAQQLCAIPPLSAELAAATLKDNYGLDFAASTEEADSPASLLHAIKVLLCRISSRAYESERQSARALLLEDLVAAGLAPAAAEWICDAAEAAVRPCADALRSAQAHAMAALSHDYLQDFDWQVNHVLGSSTLSSIGSPLVQLQLQLCQAGEDGEKTTEVMELTPPDLDAVIGALAGAGQALRSLPEPTMQGKAK